MMDRRQWTPFGSLSLAFTSGRQDKKHMQWAKIRLKNKSFKVVNDQTWKVFDLHYKHFSNKYFGSRFIILPITPILYNTCIYLPVHGYHLSMSRHRSFVKKKIKKKKTHWQEYICCYMYRQCIHPHGNILFTRANISYSWGNSS